MEIPGTETPHIILAHIAGHRRGTCITLIALLCLNVFAGYYAYRTSRDAESFSIRMLDVGQGDSSLITLPGNIRILIDAGPPNKRATRALASALGPFARRIDLTALSHPQLDHFGGMIDALRAYTPGTLLETGSKTNHPAFASLESALSKKHVRRITLRAGDRIRHGADVTTVLWPPKNQPPPKDLNDTSLVLFVQSGNARALFTGDISGKTERALMPALQRLGATRIDILKVAHHGSKYSTGRLLLDAAQPRIAIIGVGKNSYGHPATSTLKALEHSGSRILRTDRDGTITVTIREGKATIKHRKQND